MHYLGKPGPHHSKERGEGGGSLSPLTLYFLLFLLPHPPNPLFLLPAQRDGLPLYPVSTEPPFPNKRIINGAFLGAGLSCTITPAHPAYPPPVPTTPHPPFFPLQMGTEKRGYELSTQHLAATKQYQVPQCKHHISATWETFTHLFLS